METTAKKNYRSHKRAIRTRNAVIYVFLIVLSIVWLPVLLIQFLSETFCSFASYCQEH